MGMLGNLIWFIFGGFFLSLGWFIAGILWSLTILGIPVGMQCFKFAKLALFPFGKEIVFGGGTPSFLLNLLWIIFSGFWLSVGSFIWGCICCVTIIGIPFGMQYFKLAKLALLPFGSSVIKSSMMNNHYS